VLADLLESFLDKQGTARYNPCNERRQATSLLNPYGDSRYYLRTDPSGLKPTLGWLGILSEEIASKRNRMFWIFPPSKDPTPSEYAVLIVFVAAIFIILGIVALVIGFRASPEKHHLAVALEYR